MINKVLTISIAAYNVEEFVGRTLDSLILPDSHMEKLDVIVIDDGSKDHTAEIVKTYAERFPDSIRLISKENGGYGSTINTSLFLARGKYYKLLDGDDWYNTEELCGFIDYLEHADADIILSPFFEVTASMKKNDSHPVLSRTCVELEKAEMTSHLVVMHELTIRTERLMQRNISISEKCFYTDAEFVFECLARARTISRYEGVVYCYRLGFEGQSVSLSGIRKHYTDMVTVSNKMYGIYDEIKSVVAGQHKALLECMIDNITHNTYKAYMLLENPSSKKYELMDMDRTIKKMYPDVYRISMSSKTVRVLRILKFIGYGILCRMMLKRVS